jgi:biotin synthase-like enzyme
VGKRESRGEEAVIFKNGYLTTPGQPAQKVWGMIEDLGFKIEVDHQQADLAMLRAPYSILLSPATR